MKKDWTLQGRLDLPEARRLVFDEVLVFYMEPQIGIVAYDDGQCLAVAADEERDKNLTRWLLTEVTHSDILAIKTGAQTLREAFETNETIDVVDTSSELEVQAAYQVPYSQLAECCLPNRGAFLPNRVCEKYREELRQEPSSLHVEGESIENHMLPFRVASDLLGELQRLWNALAQVANQGSQVTRQGSVPAGLRERAMLSLASISDGSAKLGTQAGDRALNDQIAELFAELVNARLDEEKLHQHLDNFGPRVESAYGALVESIQRNQISVFAANQRNTAYLTPQTSAKIKSVIQRYEPTTQTRKAHGYFVASDLESRSFRFREIDNGEEFEGVVALSVAEELDQLALGEPKKYEIEIEITRNMSPTEREKGQEIVLTSLQEDI